MVSEFAISVDELFYLNDYDFHISLTNSQNFPQIVSVQNTC